MLLPLALIIAAVIGFGVWRRFGAIQWIWLLFSTAIALLVIWLAMLVFVIGPEMRRRPLPAPTPTMPGPPTGMAPSAEIWNNQDRQT